MGRGLDGFLIFVLLALCGFEGPRRVSPRRGTLLFQVAVPPIGEVSKNFRWL